MIKYAVAPEALRKVCDPHKELHFCHTTEDAPAFEGVIGQDRAVRSMNFGLQMKVPGYNIFVVGPHGTGKTTYAEAVVAAVAQKGTPPLDWCYLYNFADKDRPRILSLPAGKGRDFQKEMGSFSADLPRIIAQAFENSQYEKERDDIIHRLQEKLDALSGHLKTEAQRAGFIMKPIPPRFVFFPVKDGAQLPQEEYEKLTEEEKRELDEKGRRLTKLLDESMKESQHLEEAGKEEMQKLESQIVQAALLPPMERLRSRYKEEPGILEHLEEVLKDVTSHYKNFLPKPPQPNAPASPFEEEAPDPAMKYQVNLFVHNGSCPGSPVVVESNPTYYNLFGKLEYKSHFLTMSTDFTMIRPGALHKANGGFLILQARDLLRDVYAWETLKKALKYRKAVVENIGEEYRLVPSGTLRPEPMPLELKVILVADPEVYSLLFSLDEDMQRLFKVRVDFDVDMPRTPENLRKYVAFVSALCKKDGLLPFERSALARLVEHGSRLAGDQRKLSTRFNKVAELIYESSALAETAGESLVRGKHVEDAVQERKGREDILEESIREEILRRTIIINTEGEEVGQINGLSVLSSGGYSFGMPSRITARTFVGTEGIINIERETRMSGSIHTKGVLTLSGYLGGKFAQKSPLGLTAQITFEQSYGGVEGDSASSAELYAILSSLAGVPIKQSLAVTGSVDQRGDIQPIGGATEKIEGFFAICKARGLTGEQGVIIPHQNVENLMLKEEILEAVRQGKFTIYAVKQIEEGLEILTGIPAGVPGPEGSYPQGTVFQRVADRLDQFSAVLTNRKHPEEESHDGK